MTPYTFDTLSASKQLREAGMAEGVAEAVVSVFQHATASVDFGQLATKADIADMATKPDLERFASKADLERFATKADLERFATKGDLERFATKADLERFATKADVESFATTFELQTMRAELKADMSDLSARISDTLRTHTLIMVGGLGTLLALFTYVARQVS